MKIILLILFFSFSALYSQNDTIKTVDSVDLTRYAGKWYEIAKIPNFFQDQCEKNATATYQINGDGDITVTNECIDYQNELDVAEGTARIVDRESNSKLEVSFVSILGWNVFWGDYWILELDPDYSYAAIGTPSRKLGWILSRTPEMSEVDLQKCYDTFEKNGFNVKKFELSPQDLEN